MLELSSETKPNENTRHRKVNGELKSYSLSAKQQPTPKVNKSGMQASTTQRGNGETTLKIVNKIKSELNVKHFIWVTNPKQ